MRTYDENLVVDAIRHEVRRGGQVFYLHNRVQTIDLVAQRLRAHGYRLAQTPLRHAISTLHPAGTSASI